jgi:hypothetical protein
MDNVICIACWVEIFCAFKNALPFKKLSLDASISSCLHFLVNIFVKKEV